MSKTKTAVKQCNLLVRKTNRLVGVSMLLCLLGVGYHMIENNSSELVSESVIERPVLEPTSAADYDKLVIENQKLEAVVRATKKEVQRLSNELKRVRGVQRRPFVVSDDPVAMDRTISLVSDHIQSNEAFSPTPYCDSDNVYHNGYGTVAKMVRYNVGETLVVKTCDGKTTTVLVTENNRVQPERTISKPAALVRKRDHLLAEVLPYLCGKRFRSNEELVVAIDTVYNRGITQSRSLFHLDGTVNCESLYGYMTHSNKKYEKGMRKRYAKNYALCIQS